MTVAEASRLVSSGPIVLIWLGKGIGCSRAVGPGGTVLARGPYGEHAEALVAVEVEPRPPIGRGTQLAPALEGRGYRGP
jgi:hypothetical protein